LIAHDPITTVQVARAGAASLLDRDDTRPQPIEGPVTHVEVYTVFSPPLGIPVAPTSNL
jgi:hypothetical protein